MARWARHLHHVAIVAALTTAPVAQAQVIRGNVAQQTGAPAAGAVITLSRAASHDTVAGTDIRTVLSSARGVFTITAPSAGRYRIIVRRIGSRPYRSEVLDLAAGQTVEHDVVLEPVATGHSSMALPEIRVTRATPCQRDAADAMRIATLWNDARTALLAAEASLGSGSAPWLMRYTRHLDPRPDRPHPILSENIQVFDRTDLGNTRGFESISGDSLSAIGYWRRLHGMVTFYGPDAKALLSESFVRDHCFRLLDAVSEERDSIGLFFQPVPARTQFNDPPEIRGAAWFDASTSRLRRVEFTWVRMPNNAPAEGLGGDLAFTWSDDGVVYVNRWELRMPQTVTEERDRGFAVQRFRFAGVVEEGGIVFADSSATIAGNGSIVGDLKVAGRHPLASAHVRLLGTSLSTETDQAGNFFFDDAPAGLRVIVADHPSFSALGMRAATMRFLLEPGETRQLSLVTPTQEEIAVKWCGNRAFASGQSLLRLTVVDSATGAPLGGVSVTLKSRGPERASTVERVTDPAGAAVFCALLPSQSHELTTASGTVLLSDFTLGRNNLAVRQVWWARP